jgi:hypothetical protein
MAPLAKDSVAGRYKISYGRCLTKSAILTAFATDLRNEVKHSGVSAQKQQECLQEILHNTLCVYLDV